MKASEYEEKISKYLPENTADIITKWMFEGKIHLRISKGRVTKLGDYRPPQKGLGHKISINHNLNPYHFLIILVHEYAHFANWNKHQNKVSPHGKEWAQAFRDEMQVFFDRKVFPADIEITLARYLSNPKSNTTASKELDRVLRQYDLGQDEFPLLVEDIEPDLVFAIPNGKIFQMKEKKRSRYRCLCLNDGREYAVSGLAKARLLSTEERKNFSRGFLRSLLG
jgi:hypothetical protein